MNATASSWLEFNFSSYYLIFHKPPIKTIIITEKWEHLVEILALIVFIVTHIPSIANSVILLLVFNINNNKIIIIIWLCSAGIDKIL